MRLRRSVFGSALIAATACGGAASSHRPAAVASSTKSTDAEVARPADSATSAPSGPWTSPGDSPTPEQVQRECGPLIEALRKATEGKELSAALLRTSLDAIAKDPPMQPPARFEWCKALTERDLSRFSDEEKKRSALAASPEVRGKATIDKIAHALQAAYLQSPGKPKLCPSAKAIPAAPPAPGARRDESRDEWTTDPGWACIGFRPAPGDDFQYEVKVNGKTFVVLARRREGKDVVEYSLAGRIDPDRPSQLSFEPNVAEKRSSGR